MFCKRNLFIIVLVELSYVSRGNSVEIAGGDLHVTGSTALFTTTVTVPSLTYDYQWRFNNNAVCRVYIFSGSVAVESCSFAPFYSEHLSVRGVLSGSNLLTTNLTYTNITYEASVVVVSFYDVSNAVDIGSSVNLKVQYCTNTSEGYTSINFVEFSPSCDYKCESDINCTDGQEGDSVAVCESDASWNYTCTNITCGYTRCADCCNNNLKLASETLNYDEYLNITCCESFIPSGQSEFTCIDGTAFSPNLTCVPVPTTPPQLTTAPTATGTATIGTDGTTESTGNSTIIDPISAGYDSSTSEQPAGGNNTRATHRMSEGDIAGTVLTCIFILECICLCVFVFALNYDLSLKLIIGLYVAGICLSIIGIFMSFFGSSTAGTVMNSVEIAGTVLGSVGITVMLGGIVMQALKGVGSKE